MNRKFFVYYIVGTLLGIVLIGVGWWTLPWRAGTQNPTPIDADYAAVQQTNQQITTDRHNAITRAVKEVSPAVVGINVIAVQEYVTRDPFFDDPFFRGLFPPRVWRQPVENLGSGFIISPDGYVLTNEHVVHGATQIIVTMTGGTKYDAKVVGYDLDSDIALLKIDGKELPFVRFGNSDEVIIGEWSIAVGNPFGLFSINAQPTVTVGVVSAIDRDFDRNAEGRLYLDMIQTDAAINRGNSGGALVNSLGELIGMNTMIFTESGGGSIGLGFAIPSNKLKDMFETLKAHKGVDRDFWIGLEIQNVDRLIALSLRLKEVRGVIITGVEPASPADKAGMEVTDVIIGINGQPITDNRSLQNALRNADLRVGDKVKFNIIREGRGREVTVKLEKR